ncbi:conserved hypothetical protein [Candidatus Accumulibacter aalborgensis]|uniref:Guanylate cyclase domain-containing protein n=1 Tax=Candidatus Accumulibacter aalborgensis TaxID=1860102 RepID=A0A1A8XML3_9PROT|nr:hypothetical protein [Candidatus Accumulibacter aalborgensis]SBT06400.1 conserved hypothetical protein [Candidatus Accumulibacter aalborgensis]
MPLEIKQHYVAFLDVLGFSEMVQFDTINDSEEYLNRLFRCHQRAAAIFDGSPDCSILQFSDSIVISKPYDSTAFEWFVKRVGDYQRLLLDEELLCRGGIAINKHFSNASFTFSAGLIDAYMVESKMARYPRVVVSPEVLDLALPGRKSIPPFLVQEDDGLFFVDYLGLTKNKRRKHLHDVVARIVLRLLTSPEPSVREKGRWLAAYSDAVLPTSLRQARFSGRNIGKLEDIG